MDARGSFDPQDQLDWRYRASTINSMNRREYDREQLRRHRRALKLTGVLFLVGIITMIYWIMQPFPIEQWFIGLGAVIAMVPYLTLLTR